MGRVPHCIQSYPQNNNTFLPPQVIDFPAYYVLIHNLSTFILTFLISVKYY